MTFGIITPIFEKTKYLLPALVSVQSSGQHVVHELQQSDKATAFCLPDEFCGRVRIVRELDTGMYDAITKGFNRICAEHPEVEILSWLNSDEQYLDGTLDIVAEYFEKHPDVDVVYGDYIQLDAEGKPCSIRKEISPNLFYLVHGVNYIMSCTVFMRRRVWEDGLKLDINYRFVADKKFYVENLRKGFTFAHIPQLLGAYTATGVNLSLQHEATFKEQARLRGELGSWCAPLRKLVRLLRLVNKLFCGCYSNSQVCFAYYDLLGKRIVFSGRLSSRWH
ncbi:MAG: hypothetical protein IJ444_07190 [Kiritimatiellae bacterium]|nr:hypothetical protein [Kiritimatiellia bacterium]